MTDVARAGWGRRRVVQEEDGARQGSDHLGSCKPR